MPSKVKEKPKFLFDFHALVEAMTTSNNQVRNAFVDALNSGEIKIPRLASKELEDCYEVAYRDFQSVKKGNVYQKTEIRHSSVQQSMMDKHGTNFWGASPDASRFEMLAISAVEKLTLVSHAKSLKECKSILKECGMGKPKIMSLSDFVTETMI